MNLCFRSDLNFKKCGASFVTIRLPHEPVFSLQLEVSIETWSFKYTAGYTGSGFVSLSNLKSLRMSALEAYSAEPKFLDR